MCYYTSVMKHSFYTGSYGKAEESSILYCHIDPARNLIKADPVCSDADYPSFILMHPNKKIVYAVRELTPEGGLNVFKISPEGLILIKTLPTMGKDPCYLSLSDDLRFLLVINYTGGSFSLFRLDSDGIPEELTAAVRHEGSGPRKDRQEAAHPHCGIFIGNRLYVTDLGMDCMFCYQLDPACGSVAEVYRLHFPAGSGPRHICKPSSDDILYVNGELSSQVFKVRLLKNSAKITACAGTLPDGFKGENITAAIRLDEDEKFLFVSNRGDDSIAMFRIGENGALMLTSVCKTGGRWPRDFDIFGDIIIIANQNSNSITSLKIDHDTGSLKPAPLFYETVQPTCIMKEI